MTESRFPYERKKIAAPISFFQLSFGLFAIFCLLLILKNSQLAIEYMSRGIQLCVKSIIPSLFPFMVLSELIVSGNLGMSLFEKLSKPLASLWKLNTAGCCAVLLGLLCGAPVGAKCVVRALEQGRITREEAERALCFSNIPSSAFMISTVGVSFWGNRSFGISLYAIAIISSVFIGTFWAVKVSRKRRDTPQEDVILHYRKPTVSPKLFTDAIRSATVSMVSVCAYVVFFSALIGTIGIVFSTFHLPKEVNVLLFCFFELSSGVSHASSVGNSLMGALLCAFAVGWSGLSVHCQILALCDGSGIPFRKYFCSKLLQGVLCVALFALILSLFPHLLIPAIDCA